MTYASNQKNSCIYKHLDFLAETSVRLIELRNDKDFYNYIGDKLKQLAGNAVVIVNSIDMKTFTLTNKFINGLGKFTDKIISLIGQNPLGMKLDITRQAFDGLSTGKIHKVP